MRVIRTENLSKTYRDGTVALTDLNLEVREAEVFGFIGPNGSGKSTTIHLLLNFIRPTSGSAFLFGEPITEVRNRRRLGYVPETISLHTYHTGKGLLKYYGQLSGLKSDSLQNRIDELLELVGLQKDAHRKIRKYSKGMLQRIALAQALLHDPELLIFDEPTSNLDPSGRREFGDLILGLKETGKTIFIASHILSELGELCDRVAIMKDGSLKRIEDSRAWNAADGASLEKIFLETVGNSEEETLRNIRLESE